MAEVLVVGAGPAGLSAAVTLARYGIATLMVERRDELSALPRAASVSTRTMELLRSWGLERAVREGGVGVEWRQWIGHTLLGPGEARPTSYPTHEQSAVVSPTRPTSVPQDHLEPVLLRHLRTFPGARVAFGTELVALGSQADGVRAVLREGGTTREVRARYVIAADGIRSRARQLLGIGLQGEERLSSAIATLFRAPLWARLGERRYRFRSGSTFLVGDAAHRVTPRGGTGMNTAIQGAHDLAWKLAWVLLGWAEASLLDSYEAEFRPTAAHNVARSADPAGGARGVEQELRVDLGARIPHLWCPTSNGQVSTLDLVGPGLTLLTGPSGAAWVDAASGLATSVPLAVRHLDAVTARGLGLGPAGAVLTRPDGAPAGSWPCDHDAEAALRTAVRALGAVDATTTRAVA